MPGKYKSSFAKIRYEVAPLKIETGRYEGVSIENRTCFNNICNVNNGIENENHVLLECPEHLSKLTFSIFLITRIISYQCYINIPYLIP
jgi:hypothetical protein